MFLGAVAIRRPHRVCVVLLCLLGCSEPRLHSALAELSAAEQRWNAQGLPAYEYTVQRLCFCAPAVTHPITVTVRDGAVVRLVYADSGAVPDSAMFRDFLTVERVFDFVRRTIAENPDTLTAVYDPHYGYPTRITVDPIFGIADDEFSVSVTGFQPLATVLAP